jgi:asparagine synthase (glutamine-hydrolysing)
VTNVLDRNLEFVRDMLLDGLLVRERLLSRTRLETYLSREHSPRDFEYTEIVQKHLCTEAWLRRWKAINARRAAA